MRFIYDTHYNLCQLFERHVRKYDSIHVVFDVYIRVIPISMIRVYIRYAYWFDTCIIRVS